MELNDALSRLDPGDDDQWTSNGLPRVDVVELLVGTAVTRQEITDAAPEFNRESAAMSVEAPQDDEIVVFPEEPYDVEVDHPEGVGHPDVLAVPLRVLARSVPMCQQALHELEARIVAADKVKKDADAEIGRLHNLSHVVQRVLDRQTKSDPDAIHRENVTAYLATASQARDERAERIKRFQVAGIDPRELVGSVQASKLDMAMGRKRGFGLKRPEPRAPRK